MSGIRLMGLLVTGLLVGCDNGADAPLLEVFAAGPRPGPVGRTLNAQLRYRFGDAVREAMRNGVPITLAVETRILRARRFLWPEVLVDDSRLFRLDYHALSAQYLLEDLRSGRQMIFDSQLALQEALAGTPGLRLIDDLRLPPGDLEVRVRARLHIASLPPPLRLTAYFSPDWHLQSEWFVWSGQG